MRIDKWKLIVGVAAVLAVSTAAYAQTAPESAKESTLQSRLQQKMDDWKAAGKFAGATAGVCLADGKCFGLSVGLADREENIPMKPDSTMLAGSVGKTYVAAVALQLIGEGKISLDEKISKYLSDEDLGQLNRLLERMRAGLR